MRFRWIGLLCALLASTGAWSQRHQLHVPQILDDWRDWVLQDQRHRLCPLLYDREGKAPADFVCAWPGRLRLSITPEGGRFEQEWTLFGDDQWVPLPGDANNWPQDVVADGGALTLALRQGAPAVLLPPGSHRITGAFSWSERPPTLSAPAHSGLLTLSVDGVEIAQPRWERALSGMGAGAVWLGDWRPETVVQDELSVRVHRRIEDGVPTRLQTIFEVEVSGAVREEVIGPAMPDGFIPLSLESELSVRLEADGNLLVQARPGSWTIDLLARATEVLAQVEMPQPQRNLPAEEIWSYQANPQLRSTQPKGRRPVDPGRVGGIWHDLPTFRMTPGGSLEIKQQHRGQAETRNALNLQRTFWLDFDGDGFVFADYIGGVMRSGWRLDMALPYVLQSVWDVEAANNLLVTRSDGGLGVEVRNAAVDLSALGRIESRGRLPATGWNTDLDQVGVTLNLPPGTKLLTAFDVDEAPTSWTGRWRLVDFFLLLIVTGAVWRLFGRLAGVLALLALAISLHEPLAQIWTWLNLLAAVALARVAPPGRLRQAAAGYLAASFALLLVLLIPFLVGQIRSALYPQVEAVWQGTVTPPGSMSEVRGLSVELAALSKSKADQAEVTGFAARDGIAGEYMVVTAAGRSANALSRYGEDVLVQAGPGLPSWGWTSHRLSWSGPVPVGQEMRLVILPSWLVSALRLIGVVALALLTTWFAFDIFGRLRRLLKWRRLGAGGAVAALAVTVLGLDGTAHADVPSPELLNELQQRLLAPPRCAPRCAEIVNADVVAAADALDIQLQVHALANVAVPMPAGTRIWWPARIEDSSSNPLPAWRDDDGVLWVHLNAGRHALALKGPLPSVDTLEIAFPARPRIISAQSESWLVAGVQDRALAAGALSLTRLRQAGGHELERWTPSRLPSFLRVERRIDLGLNWRVTTQVHRVAPRTGVINVEIPLLDGEAVLSGEHEVRDGKLLVSMHPQQGLFEWSSSLPPRSSMRLQAPLNQSWREVWRFVVGDAWRVEFAGVPESQSADGYERIAKFDPRSGESVQLEIARPESAGGNTLAFDEVLLETSVGKRLRSSELTIEYRSTRGASHRLQLPAQSDLRVLTIDGEDESLPLVDAELNLPILPGQHRVVLRWNEAIESGFRVRTPSVELNAPSSNITTRLTMPGSRWLVFTSGPNVGPAILYWPELVALIAAAFILGRFKFTPLRTHHWLLLGLGFSTFSWLALALVAAWPLALGGRQSWGAELSWRDYNVSQAVLALLTLVALITILAAVPYGLLGDPDMQITGFQSNSERLSWFSDQTDAAIPIATAYSLPTWFYKALMLLWALWLSFALLRWLPWSWKCFSAQGLWRKPPLIEHGGAP